MNKNIKLDLPEIYRTPLIHVEAFRHSEENTDRTTEKLIDAKFNERKRKPHCFIC